MLCDEGVIYFLNKVISVAYLMLKFCQLNYSFFCFSPNYRVYNLQTDGILNTYVKNI